MNKKLKALAFFTFFGAVYGYGQTAKFELLNPSAIHKTDEPVVLQRSVLEKKLKRIPANQFIDVKIKGKSIPLQFDDVNGDKIWDEAVFLYNFNANERLSLSINIISKRPAQIEQRAHVRQRRKINDTSFGPQLAMDVVPAGQPNTDFSKMKLPPFLTEGPAWENDKVGFRIYMDVRNTKDIWGKTTKKMMMDTVGANPKEVYHNLADWGMDILAVGKSLGAGSLAMNVKRPGKTDTLVRLGGVNMGKIVYERVSDGPYRAVFRMHYPEWNVLGDGKLTSLTEEITIWGGKYFYESSISVKNAPAEAILLSGIVNLKSKSVMEITPNNTFINATFDQQSENKDQLGMAIMTKADDAIGAGQSSNTAGDVRNTYLVMLKVPAPDKKVGFRYYACWERTDAMFSSAITFKSFLTEESLKFNEPVQLK